MNAVWRMHLENVALRQQIRQQRRTRPRVCVYCGAPTESQGRVCPAHRDLPRIDPGYSVRQT